MIATEHLSKSYKAGPREKFVLKDVSLEIPEQSFSAIVGKSGSGKSTLLNLIAGLDTPTEGNVTIGTTAVSELSNEEAAAFRLKNVGLVFQFFNLLPTLSLSQNVGLPGNLAGLSTSEIKSRSETLLSAVGLEHVSHQLPHEVSGGEIQRAAIARALFSEPNVILADEPTGNLDSQNGEMVLELFIDLVRKQNATLVVVTHDSTLVERADSVFTLQDGVLRT